MATEQQERNDEMLRARVAGATLEQIAERHEISVSRVAVVTQREGRRHIDDLELRLLANTKTDEIEIFLIPDHSGSGFDVAIEYFRWCLRELAKRGVSTRVHYRPTHNGVAFGVEDVTTYGGPE